MPPMSSFFTRCIPINGSLYRKILGDHDMFSKILLKYGVHIYWCSTKPLNPLNWCNYDGEQCGAVGTGVAGVTSAPPPPISNVGGWSIFWSPPTFGIDAMYQLRIDYILFLGNNNQYHWFLHRNTTVRKPQIYHVLLVLSYCNFWYHLLLNIRFNLQPSHPSAPTFSPNLQPQHSAPTFSPNLQPQPSAPTFSPNLQPQPSAPTFSPNLQPQPSAPTFSPNLQPQPSAPTFSPNLQPQPSAPTFSPNLQPQPSAPTFSPNLQPQPSAPTFSPNLQPQPSAPTFILHPQLLLDSVDSVTINLAFCTLTPLMALWQRTDRQFPQRFRSKWNKICVKIA